MVGICKTGGSETCSLSVSFWTSLMFENSLSIASYAQADPQVPEESL